jgi:hypothetical protein
MKIAIPFIIASLIIPASTPSYAAFVTGNKLYSDCMEESPLFCLGYIDGVSDALDMAREGNSRAQCVPVGVTAGQVKDVVVRYLYAHPESRNLEGGYLVVAAIGGAWNCKDK